MNDFADWLSPILVKELRQGMRSRLFVALFILTQAVMILVTMALLSSDDGDVPAALPWVLIGGLLLGIPLTGLNAVQGEIKGNTLELLLLTRLSPWRVIAGKWLALVLQGMLIVSSVLPFFMLRYFVGGFNLVQEVVALGWLLVGLMVGTAVMVGLSGHLGGAISRAAFLFISFGVLTSIIPFLLAGMAPGSLPPMGECWVAVLFFVPLVILVCFEMGLSPISPVGVNRSTRQRLLVLALLLVGSGFQLYSSSPPYFFLAVLCAAPLIFSALLEPFYPVPSLYRPLPFPARLGKLERLAAWFLLPGGGAGFQFSLLLMLAMGAGFVLWRRASFDFQQAYSLLSLIGGIYFPLAILRWIYRQREMRDKGPWVIYGGIQVAGFILALFLMSWFSKGTTVAPLWFSFLPTTGFFLHLWMPESFSPLGGLHLVIAGGLALLILGFLFFQSVRLWRQAMKLRNTMPPAP